MYIFPMTFHLVIMYINYPSTLSSPCLVNYYIVKICNRRGIIGYIITMLEVLTYVSLATAISNYYEPQLVFNLLINKNSQIP